MNHYDCRECNNCQAGCGPCFPPYCPPPCPPPYCPPPCPPPYCPPPCPKPWDLRSYAMFNVLKGTADTNTNLTFSPSMMGPNSKIVLTASDTIRLEKGHIYKVDFNIIASTPAAGDVIVSTLLNATVQTDCTAFTATHAANDTVSFDSCYFVDASNESKLITLFYEGTAASTIKGAFNIVEIA